MDEGSQTKIDETENRFFGFQEQAQLELDSIQNDIETLMKNLESLVPEDECDSDECSEDEATSAALECLQENKASTSNKEECVENSRGDESPTLNWEFLVQSIMGDLHRFKNLNNETNDVVRRIKNIEESSENSAESSEEESEQS